MIVQLLYRPHMQVPGFPGVGREFESAVPEAWSPCLPAKGEAEPTGPCISLPDPVTQAPWFLCTALVSTPHL
jgi:hypothetical protein